MIFVETFLLAKWSLIRFGEFVRNMSENANPWNTAAAAAASALETLPFGSLVVSPPQPIDSNKSKQRITNRFIRKGSSVARFHDDTFSWVVSLVNLVVPEAEPDLRSAHSLQFYPGLIPC